MLSRLVCLVANLAITVLAGSTCERGSCDASEEASLLSVRPRRHRTNSERSSVDCPGSRDICSRNQCCPGVAASDFKTFPCPTASRDLTSCQGGHKELVSALLGAMTRQEKYRFVRGVGWTNGTYANEHGFYIGDAGLRERFGIPAQNMEDNGQGFRTTDREILDEVTSWPVTLAITSSWSEKDTERFAVALGQEFHKKGANMILGPGVNIARVARGGRNAEYISGESPYLGARLVKPFVKGVQSQKVLAVMKHFVANNQENNRDNVNSIVTDRSLWEVYYPPFAAAVEAGAAAAMCSYNLVNGVHACGNSKILKEDLKGRMGFQGWVQSDWWALHSFHALDGVDQEMPGTANPNMGVQYTDENLDVLNVSALDNMVRPQLTMMLKYGLFEPDDQVCQPPHCEKSLYHVNGTTAERQELSKELATKAVTLLKNEGVLPLTSKQRIAILGSACDAKQDVESQLKQWDLGSYYNIGGSGRVIAWNPISILTALKAKCQQYDCEITEVTEDNSTQAVSEAANADIAIMCGGTTSTEGHDRASLSVDQEEFMVEVAAGLARTATPLISLTMTPGAVLMPWAEDTDAILNVFMAGKYTGTAFADVLFGDVNPSAKSPITFPLSEADTVLPCDEVDCHYTEGVLVGWQGLQGKDVLFPFGHGLSYTSFAYTKVNVMMQGTETSNASGCSGSAVCISVRVTNTGDFAGVEIAQLYMGHPKGLGEPEIVLRGFVRLDELTPGTFADITFPLTERDLEIYSEEVGGWIMPDGKFEVFVGSSSRDLRLVSGFSVCGRTVSLEDSPLC